jgi:DNA-binding SARP family transcriptional activator
MIDLQVLGGLNLAAPDRQPELRAILAQPKRLALLVYLALAGPGRFRRRDALVGLFWPELDTDHARGALRQALRFLRAELGAEVLVTRGEEEVAVRGEVLRCDAVAFERACEDRAWGPALALYRGDLLAGVFVSDCSVEFEHWLEGERVRLRRRAADAAWSAVGELERTGDLVAAAPLARRAVELDPYDEASVRRLMRLLDRRGDRAGALSTYETFRSQLASRFEAMPSPETEALLVRIRARDVQIWESPLGGWPPPGAGG